MQDCLGASNHQVPEVSVNVSDRARPEPASNEPASGTHRISGRPPTGVLGSKAGQLVPLERDGRDKKRAVSGPIEGRRAKFIRVDEDVELVRRCQRGDRAAFLQLFRRHRADVVRLIHRMLGPSADLEDLVQEVFLQVHRSVAAFRGSSRFTTWLYRVTVNVVLMHRRALRSRPRLAAEDEGPPVVDSAPLPDEQFARDARVRAFYRLLERLSEKKRTVFVLHEIEGLSPGEISALVGAPVLTVRTRLFYARREVQQLMADEPELQNLVRDSAERTAPVEASRRPI